MLMFSQLCYYIPQQNVTNELAIHRLLGKPEEVVCVVSKIVSQDIKVDYSNYSNCLTTLSLRFWTTKRGILERGEKMRIKSFTLLIIGVMLFSAIIPTVKTQPTDLTHLILDSISEPWNLDPAWCYDTARIELLMNIYETLIKLKGNHTDEFDPLLADAWNFTAIDEHSPEGIHWVGRMGFHLRTDVSIYFHDVPETNIEGEGEQLDLEDIEYTLERFLITDAGTGPSWMLHEALCGGFWIGDWSDLLDSLGNHPNSTEPGHVYCPRCGWYFNEKVDEAIDHAVESGGGWIWFNMALPEKDIMYQVMTQPWCGIMSKTWCVNHVGDWPGMVPGGDGDNNQWVNYHNPDMSPIYTFDTSSPGPNLDCALGTGPYILDYWNKGAGGSWSVKKNPNYWKGWAGNHVDRFTSNYILEWYKRKLRFLGGLVDITNVPRASIDEIRTSKKGGPPQTNYEQYQPGVTCDWGIWDGAKFTPNVELSCYALFFSANISWTSTHMGVLQPPGVFNELGGPPNFFNDTKTRLAFTHLFNYAEFLETMFRNESIAPVTPLVTGLTPAPPDGWPCIGENEDPSANTRKELGISFEPAGQKAYDLELAVKYLYQAWGGSEAEPGQLWNNGFTMDLVYSEGNLIRKTACILVRDALDWINTNYETKFHTNIVPESWTKYRTEWRAYKLPFFVLGWLGDYADVHDFAYPFMHSAGAFAEWQGQMQYKTEIPNAYVDSLIEKGKQTTNVAERLSNYTLLEKVYVEQAFGFALDQPIVRHWRRDWVKGWYYNPMIYTQHYAYFLWKELTATPAPLNVSITDITFVYGLVNVALSRLDTSGPWAMFIVGLLVTNVAIGDDVVIDTKLIAMGPLSTETVSFLWNDTQLTPGAYRISAEVFVVSSFAYDTDTVNNRLDDGLVTVPTGSMQKFTRYSWPMFHHDLTHTGYSESPAPNTNQTQWTYTIGSYVNSSPVVAEGKVYVGSWDGKVFCLNASNGAQIWNYTTGDEVRSSPAVVGGRVYVGSSDNKVYCLNALTGTHIWSYTTGDIVISSPAVIDDKVYVGSSDNKVYCLNALTGTHIWNYTTGDEVRSSPAVVDDRVYLGSDDNSVYCLNASTGAHIWNYTTGDRVGLSSPAVADGKVYVGSKDSRVYCFDASDGEHMWSYTTGGAVLSSPAIADGVVFIGSEDESLYTFGNIIRTENYPTIQAAINAAPTEATVIIAPGVYNESVVINKTLTIIGGMGSAPVFSGGGSGIAITISSGAAGSIIAGVVITNWAQGILIIDSGGCKIYDNIMSLLNYNGITLEGSSAANNVIYSNIFHDNEIAINLTAGSASNIIYKNIISSSNIGVNLQSSGNIIYANTISESQVGISLSNSNGNIIYHNNFVDNTVQASISTSTVNTWDDGYPSGGNYWSTHTNVDQYSGPNQNIPGSDGIADAQYTIAVNNIDRYPMAQPLSLHDIGITNVIPSKTVVGQGFTLYIDLRILNYGMFSETFTVAIYANTNVITTLVNIVLTSKNFITITFNWNTAGFPQDTYAISACVTQVPGETNTIDNTFICDTVHVVIPGDFDVDNDVDYDDIIYFVTAYIIYWSDQGKDPACDFDNDCDIDYDDIVTFVTAYIDYWTP